MKYLFAATLLLVSFGCNKDLSAVAGSNDRQAGTVTGTTTGNNMKIKIGSNTFKATLDNNATATAFKAMLPLTLNMEELNGNEKKYDLSNDLPTDSYDPKTITSG